jgi:hypothetical protein|tara:strand:+ start:1863 stop:2240 length:378 start_codon:yes stop_codon:yes gene_type:complete
MTEFFTNLPAKDKDNLDTSIETLKTIPYQTEYQFNVGEYDAAVGFFVKRGFKRSSAESTAQVILTQAKIDNINSQELLDKLGQADEAQLSEIITIILNANRYKSSRLGVRQTLTTKETVSRNIID